MRLCEMGVRGEKGAPHEIRPTEPRGASQLPGPLFQCPLCPIWLQGYGKNHRMRRNWGSTCGRFSVADLGEVPQKYPQGRGAGAKREGTDLPVPSQKVLVYKVSISRSSASAGPRTPCRDGPSPRGRPRGDPIRIKMLGGSKFRHLRAKSRPAGGCAPKRLAAARCAPRFLPEAKMLVDEARHRKNSPGCGPGELGFN